MCRGHFLLESYGLKTVLMDKSTTPFGTTVDFIYHNENKIKYMSSDVINIFSKYESEVEGVSDHNPIIYSYKINNPNNKFYESHHKKYKDDFLYKKTIEIIKNNIDLFKKHIDTEIIWTSDTNNKCNTEQATSDVDKIYNFMLNNITFKDVKFTLDNLFTNKQIDKDILFYHGFQPRKYKDILFEIKMQNNPSQLLEKLKEKLFEQHIKELIRFDKIDPNKFNSLKKDYPDIIKSINKDENFENIKNNISEEGLDELFNFFNENKKDKGALYTTSFLDDKKNREINNIKLTLSTTYFGNKYNQTKMLKIFSTIDDLKLYDLTGKNFKRRTMFKMILTNILTNGKYDYDISNDDLAKQVEPKLFIDHSYQCKEILKHKILYTKEQNEVEINPLCINGFWDGDKTFDEKIINHFISVYNSYNLFNKQIIGYIGLDIAYDNILKKQIFNREIVWYSPEICLENYGLFFKNNIIKNNEELYSSIYNFCKTHMHNIILDEKIPITENNINILNDILSEYSKNEDKKYTINSQNKIIINNNFNFITYSIIDKEKFISNLDTKINNVIVTPEKLFLRYPETLRGGNNDYYKKYKKYKKLYIDNKTKII
jgi:hypothetical protein